MNFHASPSIWWYLDFGTANNAPLVPGTYLNANTQLTAAIPGSDLVNRGRAEVTVFNLGQGGGSSSPLFVDVTNPIPKLSLVSRHSVVAGSAGFILSVTGSDFVAGSIIQWNGINRDTTFVSRTSNPLSFSINLPIPVVISLSPSTAVAGAEGFSLVVNGTSFLGNSVVQWNRNNRPTTFVSKTQLMAAIPTNDLNISGTAQVSVLNSTLGGGISNALDFSVVNPVPVITSLVPGSVTAGAPAFALTVVGSKLPPASVVRWNGSIRPIPVNNTQLVAAIPASDITNAAKVQITAFNPPPGGGVSSSAEDRNKGWQTSVPDSFFARHTLTG